VGCCLGSSAAEAINSSAMAAQSVQPDALAEICNWEENAAAKKDQKQAILTRGSTIGLTGVSVDETITDGTCWINTITCERGSGLGSVFMYCLAIYLEVCRSDADHIGASTVEVGAAENFWEPLGMQSEDDSGKMRALATVVKNNAKKLAEKKRWNLRPEDEIKAIFRTWPEASPPPATSAAQGSVQSA
jgi:hypothetical protein